MNSSEFLNKINSKKDSLDKFNFVRPFYDFVKFTMTTGCNCKRKEKEKLIEDRYTTLKNTTPEHVWTELEEYLNS
jgi:hypothetical protein